jgi:hypothetical protein
MATRSGPYTYHRDKDGCDETWDICGPPDNRRLVSIHFWDGAEETEADAKLIVAALNAFHALPLEMQQNALAAVRERSTDDYFGLCPTCKMNDGYLNLGRDHWFVCHEHRVRWPFGSNLFASWRQETESDWDKTWERIGGYEVIEPWRNEQPTGR